MSKVDGKLIGLISHIYVIGWIIALILHLNNKSSIGAFYLRQTLGIYLTSVVAGILWQIIAILGWLISIAVLILWIISLVYSIQGQQKAVPIVGDFYQKIFKGII